MAPRTEPRLAVITGASAGIGLALARRIAGHGRPVLAVARRAERLLALAAEAEREEWATIHPLALDVTAPGAAAALIARARELGGAEWLVNNAGFGVYGQLVQADVERLVAMVRLNCEAVVRLTHAFLPELERDGGGFVLNVASAAAFQPTPFLTAYGATKAFVLSFSEGLAEELRGSPVGVGAFCPGPVATEFGEVAGTGLRFGAPPGLLTADAAAGEALAQLRARETVRVPHYVYKLTTSALRLLPRAVIRRLSGQAHRPKSITRFASRRPLARDGEDT